MQRINDTTCRVRIKLRDPRTGKTRKLDRLVEATSVREAARKRALLMSEKRAENSERNWGLRSGWVFRSDNGTLREPSSLRKAWRGSLKAAKIEKHFTVHGLRRTFNDLAGRAGVDAVVTRAITAT